MSDYYLLITDAGKALEVAAHASGEPVKLTDFAVGDGGGSAVTPDSALTSLVNETFRGPLSSLTVSVSDDTVLEAECIIPASSGGYTIREIGIFAEDGTLYSVGNFAEQEKPAPDSGYSASLQIFADLAVSDTADITLTVQDGTWLTETQANAIYLRQDKQLGEIADQGDTAKAEARENIGCGSVAGKNIVESMTDETVGRIPVVGWEGLGGNSQSASNADLLSTAGVGGRLFRQGNTTTENHFGGYGAGVHLHYGTSGDGKQRLTANLFVDSNGTLTVEWLAVNIADGTVAIQNKRQYLPLTGGTIVGDNSPLIIKNKTQDSGLYLIAQNADGTNRWYIGNASSNTDDVKIHNYAGSEISLLTTGISLTPAGGTTVQLRGNYLAGTIQAALPGFSDFNSAPYGYSNISNTGGTSQNAPYTGNIWGTCLTLCTQGTGDHANATAPVTNRWHQQFFYNTGGAIYYRHQANTDAWSAWEQLPMLSATDARYVKQIRLGAYKDVTNSSGNVGEEQSGYVVTMGGDFGSDNGVYRLRPMQYLINTTWGTAASVSATQMSLQAYPLHEIDIFEEPENATPVRILNRLNLYDNPLTGQMLSHLIDDQGNDWYQAQKRLEGSVFVAFNPDTGVIEFIVSDVSTLWPEALSVVGLDSLPEGCDVDGSWKFDGETVYQDADIADAQTLAANTSTRNRKAAKAATAIAIINASAAIGNPREGDTDNLLLAQQYLDELRAVDPTQTDPSWPSVPAFII